MSERITIFEAFSFVERLRIIDEQPKCAICGADFGTDNPPEIHSKTTLHLVDGVALCTKCHDELHWMHDDEASVQEILELTEFMIKRGKW